MIKLIKLQRPFKDWNCNSCAGINDNYQVKIGYDGQYSSVCLCRKCRAELIKKLKAVEGNEDGDV